jgi:arylsulfatase A-like enzyme
MMVGRRFNVDPLRPMHDSWLSPYVLQERRKDAGSISLAFVDWLSQRREPGRPFFAFLNYYDAHSPYILPNGAVYRFGLKPRRANDFIFLTEYWESIDKIGLRPVYRELAKDSYDNCVAFLDEQLGLLIRELLQAGVLENTWLIVTADHGEEMGEHDLYDHGEILYRPEIHVPLVILPPAGQRTPRVVRETVSLRDLSATILDLTGQA